MASIQKVQKQINRLLDKLGPEYKALVVVHNPETGEGMMTNSCCDACGFHLADHAARKYFNSMTPAKPADGFFTLDPNDVPSIKSMDDLLAALRPIPTPEKLN